MRIGFFVNLAAEKNQPKAAFGKSEKVFLIQYHGRVDV